MRLSEDVSPLKASGVEALISPKHFTSVVNAIEETLLDKPHIVKQEEKYLFICVSCCLSDVMSEI